MTVRTAQGYTSTTPGPFRVRVMGSRKVDGQVYYTAVDPRSGDVWPYCVLLSPSGGARDLFIHAPVEGAKAGLETEPRDVAEALLFFDSKGAAYLLGILPQEQPEDLIDEPHELEHDDSHPGTFTSASCAICVKQSRFIVDPDGSVTIIAPKSIRLQVGDEDGEGGRVTVFSTEGDALSPAVLLAPLKQLLEDWEARINAISQAQAEAHAAMRLAGSSTGFANPYTGLSFTHTPLTSPPDSLGTPYLSAPQMPGTAVKADWAD